MNMRRRRFFYLLMMMAFVLCLSSCKQDIITISFNTDCGDFIEDVKMTKEDTLTLPSVSKLGYTFEGWYLYDGTYDTLVTETYDLSQVETNTLSLIAKWKYITFEYTFNTHGGTQLSDMTVGYLQSIFTFGETSKEGYTFEGWYLDENYTQAYAIGEGKIYSDQEFHAKWLPVIYTMTFDTHGGSNVAPIQRTVEMSSIQRPTDPTKEGYTFMGWYLDEELTESYIFDLPINSDVTLHAKWEEIPTTNPLTDEISYYSTLYGNTNGNLNNLGLTVYNQTLNVHYISIGSTVHVFDPETNITTSLFYLTSGGRATYLNLKGDHLYFIDSSNGYVMDYNITSDSFNTVSTEEAIYLSQTQTWASYLYNTVMYEEDYVAFRRYLISSDDYSSVQGYGYEQMNIWGTRVYYKPIDALTLNVMSYNGTGKTTVVNLGTLNVTDIYESLLYHVDNDYNAYYALILEKDSQMGLYLYNPTDGLTKLMDTSSGVMTSLNYNGISLYVINDGGIYEINPTAKTYEKIAELTATNNHINIINYWVYFGSDTLYRMNPVTKVIEPALLK